MHPHLKDQLVAKEMSQLKGGASNTKHFPNFFHFLLDHKFHPLANSLILHLPFASPKNCENLNLNVNFLRCSPLVAFSSENTKQTESERNLSACRIFDLFEQ
ncbi:hypothetical protein ILYODFUR_017074 [Ilyodon furcidens]|uniref:Uncharacterized protein n=1 Tax=Ilyodon furcidens TaxID=33524 RepID=A0ABV0UIZ7_9TELE